MLFTRGCGTVVPAGVFDHILATVKHIARYPRCGGLYVGEFDVVDPAHADKAPAEGFVGQGVSR